MISTCKFCTLLKTGKLENNFNDQVLFETTNFFVMPTIGAIVEGWLLIIPKEHTLCMASLKDSLHEELIELTNLVVRVITDCYGEAVVFEHGPSVEGQSAGCGIDHAHFHVLPVSCDLRQEVQKLYNNSLVWMRVEHINELAKLHNEGLSYLYVEQPIGNSYVTTHPAILSQSFRRVIAYYYGIPDMFDWHRSYGEENIVSTVSRIKQWKNQNALPRLGYQ